MDSIYFEDPLGLLIELASYRFEPPRRLHATPTCCSRRTSSASSAATTTSTEVHLADAIEALVDAIAGVALGRPIAEGPLLTD